MIRLARRSSVGALMPGNAQFNESMIFDFNFKVYSLTYSQSRAISVDITIAVIANCTCSPRGNLDLLDMSFIEPRTKKYSRPTTETQ